MLQGTADAWESSKDHGPTQSGTPVGKLTALLPCCLQQGQHSQDATAARSAAIPRVCLREQFLWLEHLHQNVISPLSATYLGPFGTHSASKNSLSRGKEYIPKIAPPLGLTGAGADTWSSAHRGFAGRLQVYSSVLSQPKIAAATSLHRETSRCCATLAQGCAQAAAWPLRATPGHHQLLPCRTRVPAAGQGGVKLWSTVRAR